MLCQLQERRGCSLRPRGSFLSALLRGTQSLDSFELHVQSDVQMAVIDQLAYRAISYQRALATVYAICVASSWVCSKPCKRSRPTASRSSPDIHLLPGNLPRDGQTLLPSVLQLASTMLQAIHRLLSIDGRRDRFLLVLRCLLRDPTLCLPSKRPGTSPECDLNDLLVDCRSSPVASYLSTRPGSQASDTLAGSEYQTLNSTLPPSKPGIPN